MNTPVHQHTGRGGGYVETVDQTIQGDLHHEVSSKAKLIGEACVFRAKNKEGVGRVRGEVVGLAVGSLLYRNELITLSARSADEARGVGQLC
jgi:hypothetical protein